MTKVSRLRVESSHFNFFLNNFWSALTLLENKEQVKSFMGELLTPTETKMFAKRVQIAKLLLQGNSYQTIKKIVKVTDSTIANVNNKLQEGDGLRNIAQELIKIEERVIDRRMKATPDMKERFPLYFLPEIVADRANKSIKRINKRRSVKNSS